MNKNDIAEAVYDTIRKLILESDWGMAVSNQELISYLYDELGEFISGCNAHDEDNMLEEAADVLMLLLYIVIKNVGDTEKNQVKVLLQRLNDKLLTRYAPFFDGNMEEEEVHWEKTKQMEKEYLHYMFCPSPSCIYFAEPNRGNMEIKGEKAVCASCGYTGALGRSNVMFYSTKKRRFFFETFDEYYSAYLKGVVQFSDEYFNRNKADYMKALKYWICNEPGGLSLENYFTEKHLSKEESFSEFLMRPLRNYVTGVTERRNTGFWPPDKVFEVTVTCINKKYMKIRDAFYGKGENNVGIWQDFIWMILKAMAPDIRKESAGTSGANWCRQENQDSLNNYSFKCEAVMAKGKSEYRVGIELELGALREKPARYIRMGSDSCLSIIQTGSVLMSVIQKFNLQNVDNIRFEVGSICRKSDSLNLAEFLTDIFPMIGEIIYL